MSLASVAMGVVAYGVWWGFDRELGRALWAQVVSVGAGVTAGSIAYGAAVWALRVPEAQQIWALFAGRLRRRRSA
jgi:Na+-transporting NADH:ubiquinone oxidoreductase subunit NqrB